MLWQPLHQARAPLLSSDLHWLQAGMKKLEEEEEMLHTMRQVLLFYTLAPCLTFTHTHTPLEVTLGSLCCPRRCFSMQTGGVGDQTTDLTATGGALPPEKATRSYNCS